MKTNEPKTLTQYIKWLKTAVSKDYLYDHDEYVRIKKELYQAKKLKRLLETEEKSYRGFGYQREPLKPVNIETVTEPVIEPEVVESDSEIEVMEVVNEG